MTDHSVAYIWTHADSANDDDDDDDSEHWW